MRSIEWLISSYRRISATWSDWQSILVEWIWSRLQWRQLTTKRVRTDHSLRAMTWLSSITVLSHLSDRVREHWDVRETDYCPFLPPLQPFWLRRWRVFWRDRSTLVSVIRFSLSSSGCSVIWTSPTSSTSVRWEMERRRESITDYLSIVWLWWSSLQCLIKLEKPTDVADIIDKLIGQDMVCEDVGTGRCGVTKHESTFIKIWYWDHPLLNAHRGFLDESLIFMRDCDLLFNCRKRTEPSSRTRSHSICTRMRRSSLWRRFSLPWPRSTTSSQGEQLSLLFI